MYENNLVTEATIGKYERFVLSTGERPRNILARKREAGLYNMEQWYIEKYRSNSLSKELIDRVKQNSIILYKVMQGYMEDNHFKCLVLEVWLDTYLESPSETVGKPLFNWIRLVKSDYKRGRLDPDTIGRLNSLNREILGSGDSDKITSENIQKKFGKDTILAKNLNVNQLKIYNAYKIYTVKSLYEFISMVSITGSQRELTQAENRKLSKAKYDFNIQEENGTVNNNVDSWFYSSQILIKLLSYISDNITIGDLRMMSYMYGRFRFDDLIILKNLYKNKVYIIRQGLYRMLYNVEMTKELFFTLVRIFSQLDFDKTFRALNNTVIIAGDKVSKASVVKLTNDTLDKLRSRISSKITQNNKSNKQIDIKDNENISDLFELGLSNRAYNCLRRNNIHTINSLRNYIESLNRDEAIDKLKSMNGMGAKSAEELYDMVCKLDNKNMNTSNLDTESSSNEDKVSINQLKMVSDIIHSIEKATSVNELKTLYNTLGI